MREANTEREFKPVIQNEGGNLKFISAKKLFDDGITGIVAEGTFEAALENRFEETKFDYKIVTDDGETLILNSAGSLNYQMDKVAIGSYVRISYNGKSEIKSGKMKGKEAHNFLVEVA